MKNDGLQRRKVMPKRRSARSMAAGAIMTFARRLNHVENIPQQDSAERACFLLFLAISALWRLLKT